MYTGLSLVICIVGRNFFLAVSKEAQKNIFLKNPKHKNIHKSLRFIPTIEAKKTTFILVLVK